MNSEYILVYIHHHIYWIWHKVKMNKNTIGKIHLMSGLYFYVYTLVTWPIWTSCKTMFHSFSHKKPVECRNTSYMYQSQWVSAPWKPESLFMSTPSLWRHCGIAAEFITYVVKLRRLTYFKTEISLYSTSSRYTYKHTSCQCLQHFIADIILFVIYFPTIAPYGFR